jgi:hypothetical protein
MNKTLLIALSVAVLLLAVSAQYVWGAHGVYLGVAAMILWCYECIINIPSLIVGLFKTWMECKCPANAEVVNEFADLLADAP